MNKFSCTRSLGEEIYFATLIAENAQQAKEMAIEEVNKKFHRVAAARGNGASGSWNRRSTAPPASSIAATARREFASL